MKVAIQTITWGDTLEAFEEFCVSVRRIGFEGVEFSQKPNTLPPYNQLRQVMTDSSLQVAGFCGGSILDRVGYIKADNGPYLYVDEWYFTVIGKVASYGCQVSLHPHFYKTISTAKIAVDLIRSNPDLGLSLIVDTAHCYLAGECIEAIIEENMDILEAVHLKDWVADYGRSVYRFARGFTSLGEGLVRDQILSVVSTLKKLGFQGWVVIEQDTPTASPFESAKRSFDWLHKVR